MAMATASAAPHPVAGPLLHWLISATAVTVCAETGLLRASATCAGCLNVACLAWLQSGVHILSTLIIAGGPFICLPLQAQQHLVGDEAGNDCLVGGGVPELQARAVPAAAAVEHVAGPRRQPRRRLRRCQRIQQVPLLSPLERQQACKGKCQACSMSSGVYEARGIGAGPAAWAACRAAAHVKARMMHNTPRAKRARVRAPPAGCAASAARVAVPADGRQQYCRWPGRRLIQTVPLLDSIWSAEGRPTRCALKGVHPVEARFGC